MGEDCKWANGPGSTGFQPVGTSLPQASPQGAYPLVAAILAAGLGTRLRPLTYRCPKALVPVLNRPLLGFWLARLKAAGFTRVAVNTHHLTEEVAQFLARGDPWGMEILVRHEPELLGTGGGLKKLGELLGEAPFLAVNVDILTDLDLAQVFRAHRDGALATLVLHECPRYTGIWTDRKGAIHSIGALPRNPTGPPLAYTGVQVVTTELLRRIPDGPYDLVKAWQEALAAGGRLASLKADSLFWQDLGTPEDYLAAHRRLQKGEAPSLTAFFPGGADPLMGPGAEIGPGVEFRGAVCLGAGVQVGAGASLKNTVVWDRARLAPGVQLQDCIVAAGVEVTGSAQGKVLV